MNEPPTAVRVRSEALGQDAFITLLVKESLSVLPDRIDLEYEQDDSVKVLRIPTDQIVRIDQQKSNITTAQQLMVPLRVGLFIGAGIAVLMWIVILIKLMARLKPATLSATTYRTVIVVGEVSDTPLFRQADFHDVMGFSFVALYLE